MRRLCRFCKLINYHTLTAVFTQRLCFVVGEKW